MNVKIACCILVYIIVNVVYSKSILKKHGHKQALQKLKEPKKRISTQQKAGSGHAKGPMANNIQGSVPLPVIMPFPMIPFDDRYPILLAPNGKPKKGREKKKDPKGETEDETDKDVDDENDDGGKEYKAMGSGKIDPESSKRLKEAGREREEDDEEDDNEEDQDEGSQTEAGEKSQKQLKVVLLGNKEDQNSNEDEEPSEQDEKEASEPDEKEASEQDEKEASDKDEKEVSKQDERKAYNEEETGKDNEEDEDDSTEESEEEETKQNDKKSYDNDDEDNSSETEQKKSRNKRAIYKPIIGHPEDIMPYIMLGAEEEESMDVQNVHKVTTRDIGEEYSPSQQTDMEDHNILARAVNSEEEDEKSHVIKTRDVGDEEEDEPRVVNTRAVNADEEEEEEPHDMRPRSLPDGRSYETVTYHRNVDDRVKTFQKFLQ